MAPKKSAKQAEEVAKSVEHKVSVKRAKWLAIPTKIDTGRWVLGMSCLRVHNGVLYWATTDTHRLHMLRLGDANGLPNGWTTLVDIKRLLWEQAWGKETDVLFTIESGDVQIALLPDTPSKTARLFSYTETREDGSSIQATYPDVFRVVPIVDTEEFKGFVPCAIRGKYLADATAIADEGRIILVGESRTRPFLVLSEFAQPADCEWFAVVMPMNAKVPDGLKEVFES